MDDLSDGAGLAPAVAKAVQVLRCLAAAGHPISGAVVARTTGISPSSCFNILRELAAAGFVAFDPATKSYAVGLGVLEVASNLRGRSHIELIRPLLEGMARDYDALVALWELRNDRFVLVDRMQGGGAVRIEMRIGQRIPALAGAIGRCYAAAANLPEEELLSKFEGLRWQNPVSFEEYLADVEKTRLDGYAIDAGRYNIGIYGVAAVVVDSDGQPRLGIASLTIAGVLASQQLQEFGRRMRDAARVVGRSLYGQKGTKGQPSW